MSDEFLGKRRRALEDSFFAQRDKKLMGEMKREVTKEHLSELSGVENDELLEALVDLGVTAETLTALTLCPLVLVAWADGDVAENERKATLTAAKSHGLTSDSAGYQLLESWLATEPGEELLDSWRAYIKDLSGHVSAETFRQLKVYVLERARGVAQAAGGILGVGSISGKEKQMLSQLDEAFG